VLTFEEEKEYFKLLSKYKDVFPWSYKKTSGLDPNVVIHNLVIRRDFALKTTPTSFSSRIDARDRKGGE